MEIDFKLKELPLVKNKLETLDFLFGNAITMSMWIADMEFEIAQPIQQALIDRVSNSGFGYEYKPDSFFEAQKEWYKEKNRIQLNKNQIVYSPSIKTTIAILIENFTGENEGVIVQPPVYMEFGDAIESRNRSLVNNALELVDNRYYINFKDLEEKAKLAQNKVLIICNPQNPIGRVWTKGELKEIVRICKQNNLLLISDEIHKDVILFDHQFTSALQFIKDYNRIVVCTSESKTFNLCSIADSMAIIPEQTIRNSITDTLKKYNLVANNALTRVALEAAYKGGHIWLAEVLKTVEENVEIIKKAIENSKIELIVPEGTYQVWLNFEKVYKNTEEMFNEITKKSGVALNAGHWYGSKGAMFMRMNIATSNEKVAKAITRIVEATEEAS